MKNKTNKQKHKKARKGDSRVALLIRFVRESSTEVASVPNLKEVGSGRPLQKVRLERAEILRQ